MCKHQQQFQRDEQSQAISTIFNFQYKTGQRFRAGCHQIPPQQQAPSVIGDIHENPNRHTINFIA